MGILKAIGAIAALLGELLAFIRELQRKRALDKADETHASNAAAIDAAIAGGVHESSGGQPHPSPAGAPGVSGGAGGGPGVGAGGAGDNQRPATGER